MTNIFTVNSDMCSGVPGGGKGQGCVCFHPEPTGKEQQASGFREVARWSPSEITPVEILLRQTYPPPPPLYRHKADFPLGWMGDGGH